MGLIIKNLKIAGDKGEALVNCLFDTGATLSFIRKDIVKDIATALMMPKPIRFRLGDGDGELEAKEVTSLHFEVDGGMISDEVVIVDKLAEELIVGAGTLQKWRIKLDLENDDIIIDKKALELKLV